VDLKAPTFPLEAPPIVIPFFLCKGCGSAAHCAQEETTVHRVCDGASGAAGLECVAEGDGPRGGADHSGSGVSRQDRATCTGLTRN
jgi:hypothetical protein